MGVEWQFVGSIEQTYIFEAEDKVAFKICGFSMSLISRW